MKELEDLKEKWQQANAFEQISKDEIYAMLHKKSSSVVRWILIVSILEFVFLNGLSWFISDSKIDTFILSHKYLDYLDKLNYLVVTGFIIAFYLNYRAVCVSSPAKKLIERIVRIRKTVKYYIFWNVFMGAFAGAIGILYGFDNAYSSNSQNLPIQINLEFCLLILFVFVLLVFLIWLFYKLLYGNFLKKLMDNYNELKKTNI